METLPTQFNDALTAIEASGRSRSSRCRAQEIRELLEADDQLRALGVDTVLIGSYARRTGSTQAKTSTCSSSSPSSTPRPTRLPCSPPSSVCPTAEYGERAELQRRPVKVSFGDEASPSTSFPPELGRVGRFPTTTPTSGATLTSAGSRLIPRNTTTLTEQRNKSPQFVDRGAYVPSVKLFRRTRRQHLGDNKPGGLYFEDARPTRPSKTA